MSRDTDQIRAEEPFYEIALEELREGERREGLWARALTESLADEDLARSLYMKWRVAQLMETAAEEEKAKKKAKKEAKKEAAKEAERAAWEARRDDTPPLVIILVSAIVTAIVIAIGLLAALFTR